MNGGWSIGPHVLLSKSKRGEAYLMACERELIEEDGRAAVRFSLCSLDALFLTFNDASLILTCLELAGIEARITDVNALDPPQITATPY